MSENKRNLKVWVEAEVHLSAEELAEVFWGMDSEEQAHFFNVLGGKERLVFQLQAVSDDPALTMSGRQAMQRIGEYGEKQ